MSVKTVGFYYEGDIIYDNMQYVVKAKQRQPSSKVEVVVEDADNAKSRYGKEFEDAFEFFEWLKGK